MSQSNATTRFKLPPKPQPVTSESPAGDTMRLNLELDVEVHRRLKIHAVERGVSVAKLVRALIDQELAR
jgi:predicted HicB family RNase H-like nuclease